MYNFFDDTFAHIDDEIKIEELKSVDRVIESHMSQGAKYPYCN